MKKSNQLTTARVLGSALLLGLAASGVQAQAIYRIVGPDGSVSFSDQPPAPTVQATALPPSGRSNLPPSGDLPYELRQVVNRYPVTLYTGDACAPCNNGRAMLAGRGVPFRELTVTTQDDAEAFARLVGETSLPVLAIGSQRIRGFVSSEWSQYLDAAGYPLVSQLPPGFRNTAPAPLTSTSKPGPISAGNSTESSPTPDLPPPPAVTPENPTGLVF